ncbi:hypothetical protein [Caldivirga sp.]|jgi:hypothetical protein|uniref:hypothetical protein n=1 Tax=Caldivirga sp. TaxID=2080243 RepID=UPI0025C6EFD7|nr:hypothetical protein [Caldivirga sp.]
MSAKSSEAIVELIRREFSEDSELVLSLYKAYRERGVKGVREELNTMLSKYGIKL